MRFRSIQISSDRSAVWKICKICKYWTILDHVGACWTFLSKWFSAPLAASYYMLLAEVDIGRFRQYRIRHPNSTAVDRNGPPGALKRYHLRNRFKKNHYSCTLNAFNVRSGSLGQLFFCCLVPVTPSGSTKSVFQDGGDECLPVSATGLRLNEDRSGTWQDPATRTTPRWVVTCLDSLWYHFVWYRII